MQTKTVIIMTIIFLFNFMTIVGTDITTDTIPPFIITLSKTTMVNGAVEPLETVHQKPIIITEVGNIPLRKQIHNSCATTSLAMVIDWLDEPYRTQEFYDDCANRHEDEATYLYQLKSCANKLGIKSTVNYNYNINKLKTGDIVVYNTNFKKVESNTTHASVIDSIENNTIRIANPWNIYHEYTVDEFNEIYTGEALTLKR